MEGDRAASIDASQGLPLNARARPGETASYALFSASVTLTLSILGSSVLPVPFAFSRTGVFLGLATMLLVAVSNALTCKLLLRLSGLTGHDTYEGVAEAIGGRKWKVITQLSLVFLLFGTLCGDFALLADVGSRAVHGLSLGAAPEWLVGHGGRGIMVLLAFCPVYPLCLLTRMRQLESAATCGIALVLGLAGIIVYEAFSHGLPGIKCGELPIWNIRWTPELPEAFAVFGYAFYIQPMLMPLLHEMPPGRLGVELTSKASSFVILGVATIVYGVIGVFGAARFGLKTAGDILVNTWLGGRAEGLLDAAVAAYLSISVPPVQMSLRYTVDCLVAGEDAPFALSRHIATTSGIVLSSLAVALAFPTYAEKIFAMTGATAVCLVCYIIPVVLHLTLYSSRSKTDSERHENLTEQLLIDADRDLSPHAGKPKWRETLVEVVCPVAVVVVGVAFSLAALLPLFHPNTNPA